MVDMAVETPTALYSCPTYPLGQLLDYASFWYTN